MKRYSVIRDVGYQPHHVYDHHEQIAVARFRWKRDAKRHARYLNEQEGR